MAKFPYNTMTWQRLRKAHLQREPLCRGCEAMGRITPANTVDHIVPISDGGPVFPGHDGLASYCAACHSAKTARGTEAGAIKSRKPRKGCNPDGTPLDPAHPWAKKSLRADGSGPAAGLKTQLVPKRYYSGGEIG